MRRDEAQVLSVSNGQVKKNFKPTYDFPHRCEEYGAFCEYKSPRPRVVEPPKAQSEDRGRELIPIQPRLPSQNEPSASDSLPCDEVESRYFRLFHEELAFDLS